MMSVCIGANLDELREAVAEDAKGSVAGFILALLAVTHCHLKQLLRPHFLEFSKKRSVFELEIDLGDLQIDRGFDTAAYNRVVVGR